MKQKTSSLSFIDSAKKNAVQEDKNEIQRAQIIEFRKYTSEESSVSELAYKDSKLIAITKKVAQRSHEPLGFGFYLTRLAKKARRIALVGDYFRAQEIFRIARESYQAHKDSKQQSPKIKT